MIIANSISNGEARGKRCPMERRSPINLYQNALARFAVCL